MRLSNEAISKMEYSKENNKQDIRWDDLLPNFGVRIYPSNHKVYVIGFKEYGKRRIAKFANFEDMNVDVARATAMELLNQSKRLESPTLFKNKLTVGELCKIYIDRHVRFMRSSKEETRRINRHILSRWEKAQVTAITAVDIQKAHAEITKSGPVEANRVILIYQRIINRGKQWGLLPREFYNPVVDVIQHPERKRDRWVNPDEMPRLLNAINNVDNHYVRAALWMYLLTGTRKQELLKARRSDLDIYQKTLHLLETKNGKDRYIQLSDVAIEILKNLPTKPNNPYLFPGRNRGRPLTNIYGSWETVREEAGLGDVTIHDLRRTLGSWLAQSGHPLILIAEILGHKDLSSVEIYARFGKQHVKDALEKHADGLVDLTSIKPRLKWVFSLEDQRP